MGARTIARRHQNRKTLLLRHTIMRTTANDFFPDRTIVVSHPTWHPNHSITSSVGTKIERANESENVVVTATATLPVVVAVVVATITTVVDGAEAVVAVAVPFVIREE